MEDTELMLDVGQANELKLAFRRTGWTNAEIKKLCEGDILARLLPVVRGYAEVIMVKHIINCDADPFTPQGWEVIEHKKMGQLEWDPTKVNLYLSENQKYGKIIGGNELRKELASMAVLNANVLDYLLKNPHLIPDEWKKEKRGDTLNIFFWGTIYRRSDDRLYVRYLCFYGGGWRWRYIRVNSVWDDIRPAASFASA